EPPAVADQHHVRGATREQTHGDHSRDLVPFRFQFFRLGDVKPVHVENPVAVVGDAIRAPYRCAAAPLDFACDVTACHWNHFDRQWELAQDIDELVRIHDADELLRDRGDDFFPCQGAAATLDQVPSTIALVGTVH